MRVINKSLVTVFAFTSITAITFANNNSSRELLQRKINIKNASTKAKALNNSFSLKNLYDGKTSDKSRWVGIKKANQPLIINFNLKNKEKIAGVHLFTGFKDSSAIKNFYFEFKDVNGNFIKIPSANFTDNTTTSLDIPFDTTLTVHTNQLRLVVTETPDNIVRIKEIVIWKENGKNIPKINKIALNAAAQDSIFVNQSGYNISKPKFFTAPKATDNTLFELINTKNNKVVFKGFIKNNMGDFTKFNPKNSSDKNTYIIKV